MPKMIGVDKFARKVSSMPSEIRDELKVVIKKQADDIVAFQRRLAPVDQGDLQRSIITTRGDGNIPAYASVRSRSTPKDAELSQVLTAGNTAVRYAHLVEFGTAPHVNAGKFAGSHHPGTAPQPFFFPPFRASKKKAKSAIARGMKKAIKKAVS